MGVRVSGRVLPIGSGVLVSGNLESIAADVGAGTGAVAGDSVFDSRSLAIVKVVPNDHMV